MTIASNIVIDDGQATPVAHTFIPLGFDKQNKFWYEEQAAGAPLSWRKISLELVRNDQTSPASNAGEQTARVRVHVHLPTMETIGTNDNGITPPPTLAYTLRSQHEFIMSGRSTEGEREDVQAFAYNVLDNADVKAMITNWINVR